MRRRALFYALALVICTQPLFAKQRAVTPGAGHCIIGPIADFATPSSMTRDATHLYWAGGFIEGLARAPLQGGTAERLAEIDDWVVQTMTVDDTTVYMGATPTGLTPKPGAILSVPKNGGVVSVIASGVPMPFDIEVDSTHVYWAALGTFTGGSIADDGKIERVRKDGSGRETLTAAGAPFSIALEGDLVWFGETGFAGEDKIGLYTIPRNGGARTTIRNDVAVGHITLTGNSVVLHGATETVETGLFVIAKDGSSLRAIAEDTDISGEQHVAGGNAYYLTMNLASPARLWSVPLDGSAAPTLVRDDLFFGLDEFEMDGCALIVNTRRGELLRVGR